MTLGVRVRYRSRDGALQGERTSLRLPVRLGRNSLNELVLDHPFVSEFHAVLEAEGGRVCIRDLRSRNGIYDRTNARRLPVGQPVPLSEIDNTVLVGRAVLLDVETFEAASPESMRASSVRGSVLGNPEALDALGAGAWSEGPLPLPPLSMAGPPKGVPARAPSRAPALSSPPASLPALAPLPPLAGAGAAQPSPRSPGRGQEPAARGAETMHFDMSIEVLALLGLRELAASLVPGVPLESTGDVARLITKLHDLIEVFCRSFVALQDVHGPPADRVREGSGIPLLKSTRDPAALASALLDWRNRSFDGAEAIDRALTDQLMQQAAFVDQVMDAVHGLLEELAPENIERSNGGAGIGAVLSRYRALWNTFRERFDEVSDQDRLLERIVGPDAASNYRRRVPPDRRRRRGRDE